MNRYFKAVVAFLPHLVIAMSITLLTLSITDHFNTAMAFINHSMTKGLIVIYCLISLSVCLSVFVRCIGKNLYRAVLPLVCTLMAVAMLTAVFYDWTYPREILFAKDSGKVLIFVNTLISLANAVYTAVFNRRATCRKHRKEGE